MYLCAKSDAGDATLERANPNCVLTSIVVSQLLVDSRFRYVGHKRSLSSRMKKDQVPGVTIIRPLRGIDCNMYENLASSFRQDYPLFEIVFSVAQANDPAIAVVKDLMKKYPKVDARLIIGKFVVQRVRNGLRRLFSTATAKKGCCCMCFFFVFPCRGFVQSVPLCSARLALGGLLFVTSRCSLHLLAPSGPFLLFILHFPFFFMVFVP